MNRLPAMSATVLTTPSFGIGERERKRGTASALKMNGHGTNVNDPPITLSFHEQINTMLQQWHQSKNEKKPYQQQTQAYDEFDRMMDEDLANQLKELEREEDEEAYRRLEKILEEQLKLEDSNRQQTKQEMFNRNDLLYRIYGKNINLDRSEQNHNKYLNFAFNKAQQLTNLLTTFRKSKKYHIQK